MLDIKASDNYDIINTHPTEREFQLVGGSGEFKSSLTIKRNDVKVFVRGDVVGRGGRFAYDKNGTQAQKESGATLFRLNGGVSGVLLQMEAGADLQDFYSLLNGLGGGNKGVSVLGFSGLKNFRYVVDVDGKSSLAEDWTFRGLKGVGLSKTLIRMRNAKKVRVHDCLADSNFFDGDNCAGGFHFGARVDGVDQYIEDVIFEECVSRGWVDSHDLGYFQGDGFVMESKSSNIKYIRCVAEQNADGGWDVKPVATLEECTADGNKRNFRMWNQSTLVKCMSRRVGQNPKLVNTQGQPIGGSRGGYWVGTNGVLTLNGCVSDQDETVFLFAGKSFGNPQGKVVATNFKCNPSRQTHPRLIIKEGQYGEVQFIEVDEAPAPTPAPKPAQTPTDPNLEARVKALEDAIVALQSFVESREMAHQKEFQEISVILTGITSTLQNLTQSTGDLTQIAGATKTSLEAVEAWVEKAKEAAKGLVS